MKLLERAPVGLRLGLPLPLGPGLRLEVGVGPAQQFVDVRTDKLTGSRATRWQVPVTLAWQEAATATSALTRCPTWRCAALQQLLLAAELDLAWLSSAWHDKASKSVDYFILQRFVAAIAALPLLLSLPQPQSLFPFFLPPLASAVPPASVASCCCCCFAGNE